MQAAESLARRIFRLTAEGTWGKLPALIHPEARIEPVVAPGISLSGRDEYERFAHREVSQTTVHEAYASEYHPVRDDAVVVVGRVRWSNKGGGFRDVPAVWVIEVRDGLLWRSRHASSLEAGVEMLSSPIGDESGSK